MSNITKESIRSITYGYIAASITDPPTRTIYITLRNVL